jgi:hypothetical protein
MQNSEKKRSVILFPPKPAIRTVIFRSPSGTWLGCIYLSSFDLTGQILMLLKSKTGSIPPELSKLPLWVFSYSDRTAMDIKMTEIINSLLKSKKQ